jgi:Kef-type K+ transport system membrane component KefB
VLLLCGYFAGRLAGLIRLPSITGYIVAGLVLGDSVVGLISHHATARLQPVTEVALAFIAITIGGEFQLPKLRRSGAKILVITVAEAFLAFAVVGGVLTLLGLDSRFALLLGGIAAATAPAATVVIVRELKMHGEFVDYLYGVVAFDDAIAVLLFSVILAMVTPLFGVAGAPDGAVLHAVAEAGTEIGLSVLVGAAGSVFLHLIARRSPSDGARLVITVAVVFVVTAGALALELSPLLANMAFGALLINLSPSNRQLFMVLEPVTPPIFALFFILAGAELQLAVFAEVTVVILGLAYLAARFAGKFTGAYIGARVMRAPAAVRRYLGFCLFPQAGVAIGLALFLRGSSMVATAGADVQRLVTQLVNIVLLSVFINELIGPLISRFGVTRGVAAQR